MPFLPSKPFSEGLTLQHSGLKPFPEMSASHWASVQVLDVALLIQLPADVAGEAAEDSRSAWAPAIHV